MYSARKAADIKNNASDEEESLHAYHTNCMSQCLFVGGSADKERYVHLLGQFGVRQAL